MMDKFEFVVWLFVLLEGLFFLFVWFSFVVFGFVCCSFVWFSFVGFGFLSLLCLVFVVGKVC